MSKLRKGFSFLNGNATEVKEAIDAAFNEGEAKEEGVTYNLLNHQGELKLFHVQLKDIVPNEKNFYEIGDVEALKESIVQFGLKSPLEVTKLEDGRYKLLSGERRYTALNQLVEEGKHKGVVSVILTDPKEMDLPLEEEEKELLAIMTTNHTQRIYTEADKLKEATYLGAIYDKIKEKKQPLHEMENSTYTIEGKRKREFIAQHMDMSPRQAGKYLQVSQQANPSIIKGLEEGKLSIDTATKLLPLEKGVQEELLRQEGKITNQKIEEVLAGYELEQPKRRIDPSNEQKRFVTSLLSKKEIEEDLEKIVKVAEDKEADEREIKRYKNLLHQLEVCILRMEKKRD